MNQFLQTIAAQNDLQFVEAKSLSGGDINAVYLLKCKEGSYVLKVNDNQKFPGIFSSEANGLRLLEDSNSFRIPQTIATDALHHKAYLLMEYIASGTESNTFWEHFARNLATLHKTTHSEFGLDHDNYIGSLPQQNGSCLTASEFFITQRLEPQFRKASKNGFTFKNIDSFFKNISEEIPKEAPSLIHGDLWGGNYMVDANGNPVLIDPAVAFAPREMDLAMMNLFGGFSEAVYSHYNTFFPLEPDWEKRLPIWQLYYLLVHLNIFGSGYLMRVKSIVTKFS